MNIQNKLETIETKLQALRDKYIYSLDEDRKILIRRARALSIQREKLLKL